MYYKQEIGKIGETEAANYLEKQGYKILDKNFSCKQGEIDLIALDKEEIVFIEIKTRINKKYGLACEAVTKYKLKHIYKTAEYYLYTRNMLNERCRIDVIEVYLQNNKFCINHLKQVV